MRFFCAASASVLRLPRCSRLGARKELGRRRRLERLVAPAKHSAASNWSGPAPQTYRSWAGLWLQAASLSCHPLSSSSCERLPPARPLSRPQPAMRRAGGRARRRGKRRTSVERGAPGGWEAPPAEESLGAPASSKQKLSSAVRRLLRFPLWLPGVHGSSAPSEKSPPRAASCGGRRLKSLSAAPLARYLLPLPPIGSEGSATNRATPPKIREGLA